MDPLYKSPQHVILTITSSCNLKCKHCYGSFGEESSSLPLSQWKKIIKDIYLNEYGLPFILTSNLVISSSLIKKYSLIKTLLFM